MYNISIFIVWLGLFVPLPSLTYMKMLTAEDFNFWPILGIHKQCPLLGSTTHTNIANRLACFTSWSTAVILEKNVYNKRTRQINVRTCFSWVKQFHWMVLFVCTYSYVFDAINERVVTEIRNELKTSVVVARLLKSFITNIICLNFTDLSFKPLKINWHQQTLFQLICRWDQSF